jgi:2-oxoisovalerate dehydrogenase E1 component alpha subunit
MCRNNQWAISVPSQFQTASETLAIKAQAYGIDGVRVDGNDVFAVYAATLEAADKARRGKGPTLIEAVTYRLGGHTTSDDPRLYRDDEEVKSWKRKDPLLRFRSYLMDAGHLTEDTDTDFEKEIKDEIETALNQSEKIGPPPVDTMFEDVLDEMPWHLEEQREELRSVLEPEIAEQKP